MKKTHALEAQTPHSMTRMMPPLEVAPVETLEALQVAHLFLCRKCAHSMLPLHSLQYGLNLPCSQVLRGRQSRRLKRSVGSALVTVSLTCDGVAVVRFPTTGIARSGARCFYTSVPVLVKSAGGAALLPDLSFVARPLIILQLPSWSLLPEVSLSKF